MSPTTRMSLMAPNIKLMKMDELSNARRTQKRRQRIAGILRRRPRLAVKTAVMVTKVGMY